MGQPRRPTGRNGQPTALRAISGRTLVAIAAALFAVSATILGIASVAPEKVTEWSVLGPVDVVLAVLLVVVAAMIRARHGGPVHGSALARAYGVAVFGPVVLFLVLSIVADRVVWNTLLPGLAWRVGLFLFTLPSAIAVWVPAAGHMSDRLNEGRTAS